MRFALYLAVFIAAPTFAQQAGTPKPCEELKAEIVAILEKNGVKAYVLEIVANDKVPPDAKVVGTCDGGTKKITYVRK